MKPLLVRSVARAYLMSFAFWSGIALLMGLQYRPLDPHALWSSLGALLIEVALRGLAFALWTPPIFFLVGKYLRFSKSRFRYLLLWALGVVPFVVLQTSILWILVPPYNDELRKYMPRSAHSWMEMIRGAFADQVFIYIAVVVAAHAYQYLKRLQRQERERYEYQQALAASELQALKMQLHPHFLFNTLHGIATLIDSDPKNARVMILKLSGLLRIALDRNSADLIYLHEELEFVEAYLDLERMRFGDRLTIERRITRETQALLVPQMILQPIVENAIRHGIASSRERGWLTIEATKVDNNLEILVSNSVGMKASNGTGVGLRNVEARLKYLYAGEASMRFSIAENRIATLKLILPALSSRTATNGSPEQRQSEASSEERESLCAPSSSTTSR
jgi:two-component system LytT family sensor kinase